MKSLRLASYATHGTYGIKFFFCLKKKIHTDIPAEDLKKDIHQGKNGKTTKYSDGSKNEKGTGFGLYRIETGVLNIER